MVLTLYNTDGLWQEQNIETTMNGSKTCLQHHTMSHRRIKMTSFKAMQHSHDTLNTTAPHKALGDFNERNKNAINKTINCPIFITMFGSDH